MTADQAAMIEQAISEYMPLYDRYLDELNPKIREQLKAEMQVLEAKYGIPGEWY